MDRGLPARLHLVEPRDIRVLAADYFLISDSALVGSLLPAQVFDRHGQPTDKVRDPGWLYYARNAAILATRRLTDASWRRISGCYGLYSASDACKLAKSAEYILGHSAPDDIGRVSLETFLSAVEMKAKALCSRRAFLINSVTARITSEQSRARPTYEGSHA